MYRSLITTYLTFGLAEYLSPESQWWFVSESVWKNQYILQRFNR